MKLKPSLFPAILFLAALAIQLLPGCAPSPERCRLEQIESIIDEHPDSAMTVLDSIDTAALRSDRDRALYDLLYNLALYKSFNDSLDEHALKHAVDVFSDCGETSHAIRSNYLLGNMYRLSDKIIPAVVTLSQGLELASQSGDRFNEGLCALSLYELYGKAYDSKRQIKYSRQAAEAFREAGKTDWELYALLYLSSGFINTEQYDSALIVSADILNNKSVYSDSSIMAMASDVMAMSASKTGNIPLAVKSYANAIRYDKGALSNGIFNIMSFLNLRISLTLIPKMSISLENMFPRILLPFLFMSMQNTESSRKLMRDSIATDWNRMNLFRKCFVGQSITLLTIIGYNRQRCLKAK